MLAHQPLTSGAMISIHRLLTTTAMLGKQVRLAPTGQTPGAFSTCTEMYLNGSMIFMQKTTPLVQFLTQSAPMLEIVEWQEEEHGILLVIACVLHCG